MTPAEEGAMATREELREIIEANARQPLREAEAARKRRFRDKRREAGWQDQLVWLSPEGQAALADLRQPGETLDTCINRALITAAQRQAPRTSHRTSPSQTETSPVPSPPLLETREPRHQAQSGTSPVPSPVPSPPPAIAPKDAPVMLTPQARKAALLARVQAMQAQGMSLRAMAAQLNAEGVPTISGRGTWQAGTLGNLLAAGEG